MRYNFIALLCVGLTISGCAITSGLQTYDLPPEGTYQTEAGTQVNVIKLTQKSLVDTKAAPSQYQNLQHLFNVHHPTYILNSGDTLSIYLWAHPEITPPINNITTDLSVQSNGYQIDQQGYIQFPIIGRYKAAGKSLPQINQELYKLLGRYLKTPDVVVRVLSYQGQRFSVQGQVLKAGQFILSDQPISLYTALGMAGGVNTQFGDNTSITLVRQGTSYPLNTLALEKAGYSLHQLLIQANDTIYVNSRESQKIYVMGESGKNQSLILREQGMSLADALGESLGLNPLSASRNKIYIVRNTADRQMTEIYHLDLTSIADFGLANQFAMQRNDIIYVDASGLARWQRVFNQVMPFSNMIYNFDRMGQ